MILSAANTHTGQTRVQSGVLGLANVNALATSVLNTSGSDTGTLSFLASDNTYNLAGLSGNGSLDAGGKTLSIGATNQTTEFSGAMSNGALTKVGTGTLTLSGSSNFTGNVTVNAGTLKVANSDGLGTGTKEFVMQGGSRVLQLSSNVTLGNNITLRVSSNSFDGGGIYSVDGTNEIQGNVLFDTGNPGLNISSSAGSTLTVSGSLTLVATSRTLYLGGASTNDNTISGVIGETGTNVLSVIKQGAGTWVLSGSNSYTGLTTVTAGTLAVQGSLTSAVTVNAGTLSGTGSTTGAVVIGDGAGGPDAFLAPGSSPGTFTTTSTLSLLSDATFVFDLESTSGAADTVVANGVSIDSSALFSFNDLGDGSGILDGQTFTVIDNTSASPIGGTFTNLPDGASIVSNGITYTASYSGGGNGNSLVLTANPVPEPSTWVMLAAGTASLLAVRRRRRSL